MAEATATLGEPTRLAHLAQVPAHPWFAATYNLITRWSESRLFSTLRPWIAGQATGRVLEIGAGTGANFPYYRGVDKIVAIEPDPYMLWRARKRAQQLRLPIELRQAPAEALPFPDAFFDTVVATLVLCTVADPDQALREVRRVVKPEGTLRFIEHVRSEGRLTAGVQELLTPLWSRVGAGCHLARPTAVSIAGAGFGFLELQSRHLPLTPLIAGVASPRGGQG